MRAQVGFPTSLVVAGLALTPMLGCESAHIDWVYRPTAAWGETSAVVAVEARIERGGCGSGDVVYDESFLIGMTPPRPMPLGSGRIGVSIALLDATCRVLGALCRNVDLPTDGPIELEIPPGTAYPGCESGEMCAGGICRSTESDAAVVDAASDGGPGDGGSDAGRTDAGSLDGGPPLDPALVAWYRFDEMLPFAFPDDGPHSLDAACAPTACPRMVTGVAGTAIVLDGTNDSLEVPFDPALMLDELTVLAWARRDSPPVTDEFHTIAAIPLATGGTSSWALEYFGEDAMPTTYARFGVGDASSGESASGEVADVGLWRLLAGTYDGASVRIYVDGSFVEMDAHGSPPEYDGGNLYIGANTEGGGLASFMNGAIDELRIYSRALDAAEIDAIYQSERL